MTRAVIVAGLLNFILLLLLCCLLLCIVYHMQILGRGLSSVYRASLAVCDTIRADIIVAPTLNRVYVTDHPDRPVQGWEER